MQSELNDFVISNLFLNKKQEKSKKKYIFGKVFVFGM